MAVPSRVNVTASANWTATSGTTFPSTATSATAGNTLIVVVAGLSTAGQTITGVTDTAGNTYTKIVHVYDPADNHRQEVWYAKNITGHAANIVTPTWSAAVGFRGIVVAQYAGLDPAGSADGFATGTAAGTATTVTSGTLTTTKWDDLHLLIPAWALGDTATYPAGFSASFSGNAQTQIAERFVVAPSVGTYTITHTNATFPKSAIAVAFAPAQLTPDPVRVTQAAVEALTQPAPAVQVTQAAVEVLGSSVAVFTTAARVTQDAIELVSLPSPALAVTQAALEVLYRTGGRWKLTIDGIDRTALVDSFSYSFVLNERGRASLVLGDFLPDKLQEVVSYAKNGFTPLFGGVILSRTFTGRNQYDPTFQVTCECGDWFTYADWATTTRIYDRETPLKTILQDLVTDSLGAYGITLHPSQVDGPMLAPFLWRGKKVSDALRELSERTKYLAEITPAKRLRMFLPGTDDAPFEITEAAPHCQELGWADSDRAGAAPINKVTIICGPTGQREVHDERHYGDGATRVWSLYAPFVAIIGALSRSDETGGYPLGICGVDVDPIAGGDFPYCYNPADNTIHQRADQPLVLAGAYLWLWYLAEFPFQVSASCPMDPVVERTESRTDILSIPAGQEVADSLLTQFGVCGPSGGENLELAIRTDEDGFEVGQALTVDLPTTRSVSGDFVITELAMTIVLDTDQGDAYWTYQLKAGAATTVYQGSYLEDWRRIVAQPSIITEVQAEETRTINVPRKPKPTEPVYRPRYIEPGSAIHVVPALEAKPAPKDDGPAEGEQ